jgi:transcriptional regulator with XRE-family HTH domain
MPAESASQLPFAALVDRAIADQSLSLTDVARRVDDAADADHEHVETSKQQVHRWRRGPQVPYPQTVRWLAIALNQPIKELAAAADQQRDLLEGNPDTSETVVGEPKAPRPAPGVWSPIAVLTGRPEPPAPQLEDLSLNQPELQASWSALFGAAVRKLRSELGAEQPLTREEFGRLTNLRDGSIEAIERGVVPPQEDLVRACERVFPEGAVLLRAIFPFARAEWENWQQVGMAPPRGTLLSPGELIASPAQAADPAYLETLGRQMPEALQLGRQPRPPTSHRARWRRSTGPWTASAGTIRPRHLACSGPRSSDCFASSGDISTAGSPWTSTATCWWPGVG